MIVFAAITPHPPLLIPDIGKDNLDKIKNPGNQIPGAENKK